MKKLVLSILLVVGWTVFAHAGDGTLSKPGVLGEENIFLTERLSAKYDSIIIRDFVIDGAEIVSMDKDEQAKLKEIKPDIVKTLSESIVRKVKSDTRFARVSTKGASSGRTVISFR